MYGGQASTWRRKWGYAGLASDYYKAIMQTSPSNASTPASVTHIINSAVIVCDSIKIQNAKKYSRRTEVTPQLVSPLLNRLSYGHVILALCDDCTAVVFSAGGLDCKETRKTK